MASRGPRRMHFQVVPLPRHLERCADAGRRPAKRKHILSVAYDFSLRETRRLVLQDAGYEVTSTGARAEAIALCKQHGFDLVLMGHSVPRADKLAIIAELRKLHDTPVLALRGSGEAKLPQVDYDLYPTDGPTDFLAVIEEIFAGRRPSTRAD